MNVSFAGCGFLGIYHVGVACCFRKYSPQLLVDKIAGASAGAIAACCLLCDLNIGEMVSDVLRVIHDARKRTLGPFSPSFNVQKLLKEGLDKFLPVDAHKRVSGKLRVSLTRAHDLQNVIVTEFNTREELIQVLLASSWVPIFSGVIPPKVRGIRYMDGGLSNNLPTLDSNTITVSPFCGESDICPKDPSSQLFHIYLANTSIEISRHNAKRFSRILFPPDPETLSELCKQGFDDALRFLQRRNMIACTSCVTVQSTFLLSSKPEESVEEESDCEMCVEHRKEAMAAEVPENVKTVFREAIDAANRGLMNWLFRFRGVKFLSYATLPYVLPIEISYVACIKTMSIAPAVFGAMLEWILSMLQSVFKVIEHMEDTRHEFEHEYEHDKMICQLAVSHCGEVKPEVDPFVSKNHRNVQFKVDLHGEHAKDIGEKILSRRSSLILDEKRDDVDNILKVTHKHDALLAYYFVENEDKVTVTEIFEVTPAESDVLFTPSHGSSSRGGDCSDGNISDISLEEHRDETDAIFSDPESEWKTGPDTRPEAERHRKDSYRVMT